MRGYVYGTDSQGFREAEFGEPCRGRNPDCPDRHLVGDTAAGVSSPESDGGVRDESDGVLRRLRG